MSDQTPIRCVVPALGQLWQDNSTRGAGRLVRLVACNATPEEALRWATEPATYPSTLTPRRSWVADASLHRDLERRRWGFTLFADVEKTT